MLESLMTLPVSEIKFNIIIVFIAKFKPFNS